MASVCLICGKGTLMTGGYSNRTRATKFNPSGMTRSKPNLKWARLSDGSRMKMCTRCIKGGKNLLLKPVTR